jgi:sugar/nucleoside kinase (ribokinase family)
MTAFDITIAGEVNLDLILYGLAENMPVERELLGSGFRMTLGSSSAILAHNLAALDMHVGFITKVGGDDLGRIALDRLREAGVDLTRTLDKPDSQTGVTLLLHHGATRHILTYPGVMADMTTSELDFDYLASSRHFHLSSLFLQRGLWQGIPELLRKLKAAGLTLSLDTNDDPEDRWQDPLDELLGLIDVLLPNEDEALRMTGCSDLDSALDKLSARVPLVAVKCGRRGSIVRRGFEKWIVPSIVVAPVDTIGAGDSFNAGFLKGYLQSFSPERCAILGNTTAALSTLRSGGTEAFRDKSLLVDFLRDHFSSSDREANEGRNHAGK